MSNTRNLKNRIASAMVATKTLYLGIEAAAVTLLVEKIDENNQTKKDVKSWVEGMNEQHTNFFPPAFSEPLIDISSEGFISRFLSPGEVDGDLLKDYRAAIETAFNAHGAVSLADISPLASAFKIDLERNPVKAMEADAPGTFMFPADSGDNWESWWRDAMTLSDTLRRAYAAMQKSVEALPDTFSKADIEAYYKAHRDHDVGNTYDDGALYDWVILYMLFADVTDYDPPSYDNAEVIEISLEEFRRETAYSEAPTGDSEAGSMGGETGDDSIGDAGVAAAAAVATGGDLGSFS